jgi:hypothetical protein
MKFKMSYRIYPYLTEDEMNVHQKDIRAKLILDKLEYKEVYAGMKDNCSLKLGRQNRHWKLCTFLVILEVNE